MFKSIEGLGRSPFKTCLLYAIEDIFAALSQYKRAQSFNQSLIMWPIID